MAAEVEEVNAEIAGQKISLKSLSLNTLLTLLAVLGVVGIAVLLWTHNAESKESNAAFVAAIRELTAAQREQTVVSREGNCLMAMPPERRDPGLCQRLSR